MKKQGPTERLARIFVTEILGQTFSYPMSMRWMREAKLLVNPGRENSKPLDVDLVIGTLRAIKAGVFPSFEGKITTQWAVTWGNPTYYEQYQDYLTHPPPAWNVPLLVQWREITGLEPPTQTPPETTILGYPVIVKDLSHVIPDDLFRDSDGFIWTS